MPITTTFATVTTPTIIVHTGTEIAATITNSIANRIIDIMGQTVTGYGLTSYFTTPVSTSTRVLARQFNSMVTDLDLAYRKITGYTVTNTLTNLTTTASSIIVDTGTVISATQFQSLVNLVDLVDLNRYNLHPSQLATDGNCEIVYDNSYVNRLSTWGTGTETSISMTVRVEWPNKELANGFFNMGSDLTFSPFVPSFGLDTEAPVGTTGLLGYQFKTALDDYVSSPISIRGNGSGVGPIYHVNFSQHPYGAARAEGSTDYMWPREFGPGVSGDLSLLTQNPEIVGTPFQLVGMHYGDYTTQLFIGVRQGQTVSTSPTVLRVSINGGSAYYEAQVPGRYGLYTGSTPTGTLDGISTQGWWTNDGEQDIIYPWIEIFSGRKGPDSIGLTTAITSRTLNTISIVPQGGGTVTSTPAPSNTVTNAWAQFIQEIRGNQAILYSYDRTEWFTTGTQNLVTFTSTVLTTNTYSISVLATKDQALPGQSRRVIFDITATNITVANDVSLNTVFTYTTSSQTCTNLVAVVNSTDAATTEYTTPSPGSSGGGGSSFPWWIVAVPVLGWLFSVICLKLAELGLLEWDIIEGDREFGQWLRRRDPAAIQGYHSWAWWVIDWMDGKGRAIPFVSRAQQTAWARSWSLAIARPVALEMAHRVGHRAGRTSFAGRCMLDLGLKINSWLGRRIKTPRLKPTLPRVIGLISVFAVLRLFVALTYKEPKQAETVAGLN